MNPTPHPAPPRSLKPWLLGALLLTVLLAYSNHFQNDFHFDDAHTVVENPYIRSLGNIPRFFTDSATFSTLPSHQSYRPIVTLSLALDYWLGGGLKPFYFHLSTFLWYLVQLVLMFLLFRLIFDQVTPDPRNIYLAWFAAAWYGLHPAMAETVNYVIQRGDLLSTLGVVAALYIYAARPAWRDRYLYLTPAVLAQIAKPPALIFPAILLAYMLLFEETDAPEETQGAAARWRLALRKSVPALAVTIAVAILQARMTPPTFSAGAGSASLYIATQPLVAARYFFSFFLPLHLNADTDHVPVDSVLSDGALLGFIFLAALIAAALWCGRKREMRPIAFGLSWFLLALVPTSIFPLAEVENDHRMFFPFVGLAMSVTWSLALALRNIAEIPSKRTAIAACGVALLAVYGWGAHQRNQVWHTEESLWRDVTLKSPQNGRGLMNYGLSLMGRGDYRNALDYFNRALVLTPSYPYLEVNLGIANGGLGFEAEAERHFQRAAQLAPDDAEVHFFYARWLKGKGRVREALAQSSAGAAMNPAYLDNAYLTMEILAAQQDWTKVRTIANQTLSVAPHDATAASYLARASAPARPLSDVEEQARRDPTPENYLTLSLSYHQAGKFAECIQAAQAALRLRPDYAEAYNNIAAAYESMNRWDDAIQAATQALRLRPDLQIAHNNLMWSQAQKNAGK